MQVNNWSKIEVERAESTWGQIVPEYSKDMFRFVIEDCNSWIDLGCGFGRFLNYLTEYEFEDYIDNYTGLDSSPDMVQRIKDRFPKHDIFLHNIVEDSLEKFYEKDSILCSAVLIHLTNEEQDKILDKIKQLNVKKIAFDINSFIVGDNEPESYRFTRGKENNFRMNWQSFSKMTRKIYKMFPNYSLTTKFYKLSKDRVKVIYLLERKN